MFRHLLSVRNFLPPARACVLMYHHVAALESDVWDLAVSPANFEQQVKFLRRKARVLSVEELVTDLAQNALKRNSMALTFDDGYADNFLIAKPILDYYGLPATFFITSQAIGRAAEYWWDELENIILLSEHLPATFAGLVAGALVEQALGEEAHLSPALRQQQRRWRAASQPPPTRRCTLFLRLWQQLRPLPHPDQQAELSRLREWAGLTPSGRPAYAAMTYEQLQSLGTSPLHGLGAHTESHPALALHSPAFQRQELLGGRQFLEKAIGRNVAVVAYPYGNHDATTVAVASEAGFRAGFTTEARMIASGPDMLRLGRFSAPDSPGPAFAQQLKQWRSSQ